jgi:hypothetical protein
LEKIIFYFPLLLILFVFLILMAGLQFHRKLARLKKRRSPLAHNLLRSPGESLIRRLDNLNVEINTYIFSLIITPILIYSFPISLSYYRVMNPSLFDIFVPVILGILFTIYLLGKLVKLLKERKITRLGYEGEVAVGQQLNQLMLKGYRVYHDFPAGNFNIDHILVGQSGVFAIETKARSKPTSRNFVENATVSYDGRLLHFPQGPDVKTIAQAKHRALWLTKWLFRAIGEQVMVRPVVALPGWYVKRTSADGIPVVNPKQFPSLFEHIAPRFLSPEVISRITGQLEQKCRDAIPQFDRTTPSK